jgi:hypothetical protein
MKQFLSFFSLIAGTVVLTLALSAAVLQPKASAAPAPPPHPRVHAAIEALRGARDHMQHAEGEFHGHRDKTIEHIDAAIHEAEICEQEP